MRGALLLPGHIAHFGAGFVEQAAQILDHGIGAAEVEILVKVGDMVFKEPGIDPLLQKGRFGILGQRPEHIEPLHGLELIAQDDILFGAMGGDQTVAG